MKTVQLLLFAMDVLFCTDGQFVQNYSRYIYITLHETR